jgi:hypothetical protein
MSGAGDKASFFLSGGFYSDDGVFLDTKANRFSFRTNIDYKFNKHITIGETLYGNLRKTNPSRNYSVYTNVIPFRTVPFLEPADPDQPTGWALTPSILNGPNLYGNEYIYHVYQDHNYTLNGQVYLNINFFKGLDLRLAGAGEFYGFSHGAFTEEADLGDGLKQAQFDASGGTAQRLSGNAVLTYEQAFGDHNLKIMAGTEVLKNTGYRIETSKVGGFPVRIAEMMRLSGDNPDKSALDYLDDTRTASFFGRINYSYLGKYLLTANLRRDGSDKFIGEKRWGTFPSVNAGWRISEESFAKDNVDWLSNAKLRASWGILGNDAITQFLYEKAYYGDQVTYNFGGTAPVAGWANFKVPNADIKWEEINQTDVGIDRKSVV